MKRLIVTAVAASSMVLAAASPAGATGIWGISYEFGDVVLGKAQKVATTEALITCPVGDTFSFTLDVSQPNAASYSFPPGPDAFYATRDRVQVACTGAPQVVDVTLHRLPKSDGTTGTYATLGKKLRPGPAMTVVGGLYRGAYFAQHLDPLMVRRR